jgi:hypothetical protein
MPVDTPVKDVTKPYPLPSGAVLHLGRVPYAAAKELRNALLRAVAASPITGEEMRVGGFAEVLGNPSVGATLLQRVLLAGASDELEAALFQALLVGAYQPAGAPAAARLKVEPALLDHPTYADAVRRDYYAIAHRVVEVAVFPFFTALVSMFAAYRAKSDAAQPSTSSSKQTVS